MRSQVVAQQFAVVIADASTEGETSQRTIVGKNICGLSEETEITLRFEERRTISSQSLLPRSQQTIAQTIQWTSRKTDVPGRKTIVLDRERTIGVVYG